MVTLDGREIIFAGAGALWGATTFIRGLMVWRAEHKMSSPASRHRHLSPLGKGTLPIDLIAGLAITLACIVYLSRSFF